MDREIISTARKLIMLNVHKGIEFCLIGLKDGNENSGLVEIVKSQGFNDDLRSFNSTDLGTLYKFGIYVKIITVKDIKQVTLKREGEFDNKKRSTSVTQILQYNSYHQTPFIVDQMLFGSDSPISIKFAFKQNNRSSFATPPPLSSIKIIDKNGVVPEKSIYYYEDFNEVRSIIAYYCTSELKSELEYIFVESSYKNRISGILASYFIEKNIKDIKYIENKMQGNRKLKNSIADLNDLTQETDHSKNFTPNAKKGTQSSFVNADGNSRLNVSKKTSLVAGQKTKKKTLAKAFNFLFTNIQKLLLFILFFLLFVSIVSDKLIILKSIEDRAKTSFEKDSNELIPTKNEKKKNIKRLLVLKNISIKKVDAGFVFEFIADIEAYDRLNYWIYIIEGDGLDSRKMSTLSTKPKEKKYLINNTSIIQIFSADEKTDQILTKYSISPDFKEGTIRYFFSKAEYKRQWTFKVEEK